MLIKKDQAKKPKASNEAEVPPPGDDKNKGNALETVSEEQDTTLAATKTLTTTINNKIIAVNEAPVSASPATPNASRVTRASLAPNNATVSAAAAALPPNGLAHRLNTPTSILKKKGVSKLVGENSGSALKNNPLLTSNDTPGKRRVSFCDSIQVEEIEPNLNKSTFARATPKVQNKAKLVLTPYFNKSNSSVLNNTSSTNSTPLSSVNGTTLSVTSSQSNSMQLCGSSLLFLNEQSSSSQASNSSSSSSSSTESKETSTLTSNVSVKSNLASLMSSNVQLASNKLSTSLNMGSASASKLSSNRLSDANCLLSPSFGNSNIISSTQATSMSVPSSPSLLNNFFSNKVSSKWEYKIQLFCLNTYFSKPFPNLFHIFIF